LTAAASPEAAPVEEAAAVSDASAPVPAAPEEAPIQETAVPDTEVVVAVSADATPAEDEVLPVEETTSPAPTAPEEEHTEEAVVPVAEVVVASRVECMDAGEDLAPVGETVTLAIEVAAPVAEVVPFVAALDVDPEAPPGLLVYVCMRVHVCACVCVFVRVCLPFFLAFLSLPLSLYCSCPSYSQALPSKRSASWSNLLQTSRLALNTQIVSTFEKIALPNLPSRARLVLIHSDAGRRSHSVVVLC